MRSFLLTAGFALGLGAAGAFAQDQSQNGTAEEARAMLEQAVSAVESDKEQALQNFTAGAEGFKDRDLYVFCGGEDGNFSAHGANAALVGTSLRDLEDKAGEAFGQKLYDSAQEGDFQEVEYMWPRPGEQEPTQKSSFVTKVSDQICAVGYYPQ